MSVRETVLQLLKEVKPTMNFENIKDIIDGGYLDSLGLMTLITEICVRFGLDLNVDWISSENFNSIDAIVALIERLKS